MVVSNDVTSPGISPIIEFDAKQPFDGYTSRYNYCRTATYERRVKVVIHTNVISIVM